MTPRDANDRFVGIQVSPISFVDEGVETVLDTLQNRVGVNVLMLGTVSWLGLKSGRSISHELDGWPDHGVPEPYQMRGGAYFDPDPRYYTDTFMADYRSRDPEFADRDILEMVVPAAHERGMKVYIELMEPTSSTPVMDRPGPWRFPSSLRRWKSTSSDGWAASPPRRIPSIGDGSTP